MDYSAMCDWIAEHDRQISIRMQIDSAASDVQKDRAEAMRIDLLRARIEIEKCKWLETIANRMSTVKIMTDLSGDNA